MGIAVKHISNRFISHFMLNKTVDRHIWWGLSRMACFVINRLLNPVAIKQVMRDDILIRLDRFGSADTHFRLVSNRVHTMSIQFTIRCLHYTVKSTQYTTNIVALISCSSQIHTIELHINIDHGQETGGRLGTPQSDYGWQRRCRQISADAAVHVRRVRRRLRADQSRQLPEKGEFILFISPLT